VCFGSFIIDVSFKNEMLWMYDGALICEPFEKDLIKVFKIL